MLCMNSLMKIPYESKHVARGSVICETELFLTGVFILLFCMCLLMFDAG